MLEVMRHGVLRQKRRLEPDLGPDPLALGMGRVRGMITAAAAAKLRTEVGTLNLIVLLDLPPRGITDGSGNVNLEFQDGHTCFSTTEARSHGENNIFFFLVPLVFVVNLRMRKPTVQHEVHNDTCN